MEYRFLVPPTYTDFERSVIIAETCGQPVPSGAKEELIRKTSVEQMPEVDRKLQRHSSVKEKSRAKDREEQLVREQMAEQELLAEREKQQSSPRDRPTGIPIEVAREREAPLQASQAIAPQGGQVAQQVSQQQQMPRADTLSGQQQQPISQSQDLPLYDRLQSVSQPEAEGRKAQLQEREAQELKNAAQRDVSV